MSEHFLPNRHLSFSGVFIVNFEHVSTELLLSQGNQGNQGESGNIRENQKIPWMSGKSQEILLFHVIKKKMTLFGNSYLPSKCTY